MAKIRTSHLLTLKPAVSGMQPIGETPRGNRRIGRVAGGSFRTIVNFETAPPEYAVLNTTFGHTGSRRREGWVCDIFEVA
jgi:hypothetical protein